MPLCNNNVSYAASGFLAIFMALGISLAFLAGSPDCLHWFIVPIAICGFLVGIDAIHWLRGGYDVFDPYGIFGCLGVLIFQINPMLHVSWDMFAQVPNTPDDWVHWLGVMGLINVLGLVLLHATRKVCPKSFARQPRTTWLVSRRKLIALTPVFLSVAFVFQAYAFVSAGGLAGMTERGAMTGMGFILLIGESFPVILVFAITLKWRFLDNKKMSTQSLFLFFMLMLVVLFLMTGLRGSRSNFLRAVLTLSCVIHLVWRPIPRKVLFASILPLFLFLTVYGLYKDLRGDILEVRSFADYTERTEERRNWKTTILGDLGRSDIQTIVCSHVCSDQAKPRYGETYLQAFSLVIPRLFRPNFTSKGVAGTYALYGHEILPNSRVAGHTEGASSLVYGWAGEAMLNFGVVAAPLAFIAFSLWQTGIRRFPNVLANGDVRILMYPLLFHFAIQMNGDLNNLVFGVIKNGAFPFLFLLFVSDAIPSEGGRDKFKAVVVDMPDGESCE